MKTNKPLPIHPGEILREEFMKPLGFTGDILAGVLKVPPDSINEIVSGKRSITADMALRLARHFNTTPELWTGLQEDYDLRMARMGAQLQIARDALKRENKHQNYQRIALRVGLLLVILNGLFPPFEWAVYYGGNHQGYCFILAPPNNSRFKTSAYLQ